MMRPTLNHALIVLCLALLSACSKPAFQGSDISQSNIGGDFELIDMHKQKRSLADYRDKVIVLFFGYTSCPDVCPTTLAELRSTMADLGVQSKDVQVLFISVDPERDRTESLVQYIPAFHPSFIGLTGSKQQIDQTVQKYRAVYKKQGEGQHYTVDHTAGSYLIDRQGQTRVLINYGAGAATFTHDIKLLLAE